MSISTEGIIGITVGVAVVIGLAGYFLKSKSDAEVAAENEANRASYAQEQDEMIHGGRKKSKRRKHRKNASKKRR